MGLEDTGAPVQADSEEALQRFAVELNRQQYGAR
jgi:hypothetical protein